MADASTTTALDLFVDPAVELTLSLLPAFEGHVDRRSLRDNRRQRRQALRDLLVREPFGRLSQFTKRVVRKEHPRFCRARLQLAMDCFRYVPDLNYSSN